MPIRLVRPLLILVVAAIVCGVVAKQVPELAELELVKYSRLSVSKVTPAEWDLICKMGGL